VNLPGAYNQSFVGLGDETDLELDARLEQHPRYLEMDI
jgi:hypothetical protein